MSTTTRITLAALFLSLLASCRLQSPPAWGEGDPPELVRFLGICLGGSTGCSQSGQGNTVRYQGEALQTVEWVEWEPVGSAWGFFNKMQAGASYDTPFSASALTLPEGENAIENYARPVGQTGSWVLHRMTFWKSLNDLGEPVFDFEHRTITRKWVAEEDLPFQKVILSDGSPRYPTKELIPPLHPPHSYCLAPGASWPLGVEPFETWDNPTFTPPALYTYFQPVGGEPKAPIYRNGERVNWIRSAMQYFSTAIAPATEARYVIYATNLQTLLPGAKRWWLIWTPDGPTKMELTDGRPVCQGYRTGYGWEEVPNPAVHGPWTPERVYRSGDWQAELLPEGFTFPGYDPDDSRSIPPDELPPELDPWRR